MATLISEAVIQSDAIVITDMKIEPNKHNDSTIDINNDSDKPLDASLKSKVDQLKVNDSVFGPIQIGEISITRASLHALGATIDGHPLNGSNTFFRNAQRSFINSLQFSASDIAHHMKSAKGNDVYLLPNLLFDMASRRPITAPAMIRENTTVETNPGNFLGKIEKLLTCAQKLDLQHTQLPPNARRWAAAAKTHLTVGSSVGLQAFGIFMGLRGMVAAIKAGDTKEVVINATGTLTEIGSIAIDVVVSKIANEMLTAGKTAFRDFTKTRFALRLGRSGGLIGGALTLPFDVYTTVNSLNAASKATGKEAMDHYVSAGLSITSAAMTVILGTLAMAGLPFVGPVGLLFGAMLAIGSQVYSAVRIVDDIDDYIELTLDERWRSGFLSFCMLDVEQGVKDRYNQARTLIQHTEQLKRNARNLLDVQLKDSTEAVVNGSFSVELVPTQVWKRNWWTKIDAWEPENVPEIRGGDDTVDASEGVTEATPGAHLGVAGENKSIFWLIGDGKDSIKGVIKKPNIFHYGSGIKDLTGGEKDDHFAFDGAADQIRKNIETSAYSKLKGGAGNDTLSLNGYHVTPKGYDIDLQAGTLQVRTPDIDAEDGATYKFHSLVESIENIETMIGATSVVTGTHDRNIIKSRGQDTINAGAGNDQIQLLHKGATASGEEGIDAYFIAHQEGRFCIIEDGKEESTIEFNWPVDLIESWVIEQNSLVITSGFEFYDGPKTVVTIRDIYETSENQTRLKNNKLTFLTKDGYQLRPDLPETIESGKSIDIEVDVIKHGQPAKPLIIYSPACWTMHQHEARYYIPRTQQSVTFYSTERPDVNTCIYLDYASDELSKVEAHFSARQSEKREDLIAGCDLTYHLGERTITLKFFAWARGGADPRNMIKILRTMAVRPNHKYLLIFNDGVALNAGLTPETDAAPADDNYEMHSFRQWTTPLNLPLKFRQKQFDYELPSNEAYKVNAINACATIEPRAIRTAMEALEGEGATCLVHLTANVTLRLSTPGALADAAKRLPYSSTWELDATSLGKVEVKLENNQLFIGSCIVHLPVYENEDDLIDQVRVITEKGIVHVVDLSFDRVYLDGLDARFFKEPDSAETLPEAFTSMANQEVKVRNIAFADRSPGALSYSFSANSWILRSDKSRVESSQLRVLNRCTHQVAPITLMNVPPA
ncbi:MULTISPECIES: calcium-binding protein [unclassified Pseudomonas]|uniref:calcium-binding protein n=1 Tax=unclassified Pseudomonas TaxID=196821 RepID=UPI001F585EFD|nr:MULTISPECIES: calcium-binding protein [unclassified Pseudomonas]